MNKQDDWITDLDRKEQIIKKLKKKKIVEDEKDDFKGTVED